MSVIEVRTAADPGGDGWLCTVRVTDERSTTEHVIRQIGDPAPRMMRPDV